MSNTCSSTSILVAVERGLAEKQRKLHGLTLQQGLAQLAFQCSRRRPGVCQQSAVTHFFRVLLLATSTFGVWIECVFARADLSSTTAPLQQQSTLVMEVIKTAKAQVVQQPTAHRPRGCEGS